MHRRIPGAAVVVAVVAMLAALPAAAQDAALQTLTTADDARGWEAVGRLEIGRGGFCTGALIAPDLVLTAAHCLFDPASHARVENSAIRFLAGFRNGRAGAERGVRESLVNPEFSYDGAHSGNARNVASDFALVALAQPIRNGSTWPFATGPLPRKGTPLRVVSYAHDRATRPSLQDLCQVLGRPGGVLVTSCEADFGSSGAPIFVMRDGVPTVVSVVSSKAEIAGRRVSLGTGLEPTLSRLRAEIAISGHSRPGYGRTGGGLAATAGGAKFVRP